MGLELELGWQCWNRVSSAWGFSVEDNAKLVCLAVRCPFLKNASQIVRSGDRCETGIRDDLPHFLLFATSLGPLWVLGFRGATEGE